MKHDLNNVRISFPNIFVAKANEQGKEQFSAAFIFEPNHAGIASLDATIDAVGKAKWGEKWPTIKKEMKAGNKLLVHDGDTKASLAGYEGNLFLNAYNTVRPTVVDRDRSVLVAADGKPYSGCYVNVKLDIWAQDNSYGKRINAQLQGIQFVKDGEAFSGGGTSADASDFEEIADGADADDLA
jgi:hypothetical protein